MLISRTIPLLGATLLLGVITGIAQTTNNVSVQTPNNGTISQSTSITNDPTFGQNHIYTVRDSTGAKIDGTNTSVLSVHETVTGGQIYVDIYYETGPDASHLTPASAPFRNLRQSINNTDVALTDSSVTTNSTFHDPFQTPAKTDAISAAALLRSLHREPSEAVLKIIRAEVVIKNDAQSYKIYGPTTNWSLIDDHKKKTVIKLNSSDDAGTAFTLDSISGGEY